MYKRQKETILVKAINTSANTKHINPNCQFVINKIPSDVATPCDLNNNGILDMVLLCTDKPTTAGRAYRWYYVAYDLKPCLLYTSSQYICPILPNPIKPTFIFMVGEY